MMIERVSQLVCNIKEIANRQHNDGILNVVWKDSDMKSWEATTEFKRNLVCDNGWTEIREWNEKDEYRIWLQVHKNRILEYYLGVLRVTEFKDFDTLILILSDMVK